MDATTKHTVRNLHSQQQANGYNNEHNMTQIVSIFGGIDQILTNYLSESSNIPIDQIQLSKLKQLIETPQKYQQHNKSDALTHLNHRSNNSEDTNSSNYTYNHYYYFDKNNTYLHSIFGTKTAKTILKLINHKILKLCYILAGLARLIMHLLSFENILINILYIFVVMLMGIPYCILIILAMNKKALKLVLYTFEFWYKVSYGFIGPIALIWLDFTVHDHTEKHWYIHVLNKIVLVMLLIIVIIIISALDADQLNKKWKICYASTLAIGFCIKNIIHQIQFYNNPENVHYINILFLRFSLESIVLNASTVLTIFFFKQAIFSIIRYGTDKCVVIKCIASIKWNSKGENCDIVSIATNDTAIQNTNKNDIKRMVSIEPLRKNQRSSDSDSSD